MRKLFLAVISIAFALNQCSAQETYEPQIVVLTPYSFSYGKALKKEIARANEEIKKYSDKPTGSDGMDSSELKRQPENFKIISAKDAAFKKSLDFAKEATLITESFLLYRFYERFKNVLIIPEDIKCSGDAASLKKISAGEHLQYVVNFPEITLYKEAGESKSKVRVQLYDQVSNSIMLDSIYYGDWRNPGFEFCCHDSTIQCTINNALSQALDDIIRIIAVNSPTLQQEKLLAQNRFSVLMSDYYPKPYNKTFLNNIILPSDSTINLNSLYQCFIDSSQTKFAAFFLEKSVPQGFKGLNESKKDNNVTILTDKDIKDPGYLDDIPQTYAYVIRGVKYNNRWYYDKFGTTYFQAKDIEEGRKKFFNNLQEWNFFKENSTTFNPGFWETELFAKVKDPASDSDLTNYPDLLRSKEREDSAYIGLYKIVADKRKKEARQEQEKKWEENSNTPYHKGIRAYNRRIREGIFVPFLEKQKKDNPTEYTAWHFTNGSATFIYAADTTVVLCAVSITNSSNASYLKYFAAFPQTGTTVYEWTFLKPEQLKDAGFFMGEIEKSMNTLTKWDFSLYTLNDKQFWNNYVLLKEGDGYKYLKEVK